MIIKTFLCLALVSNLNVVAIDFKKEVKPLLDKYCLDCHDEDTKKGKFSLESIDADILNGADLENWRLIEEQLAFNDMPPTKKKTTPQPTSKERQLILSWLKQEMQKTQSPYLSNHEKLKEPEFGNYVDHKALFGDRHKYVVPGPPRIWRLRPEIYFNLLRTVWSERQPSLDNGLTMNEGSHFKDYDSIYTLDEAATSPLLSNAKKISTLAISEKTRIGIIKNIIKSGKADKEAIGRVIDELFSKTLNRSPSAEEKERFTSFYSKAEGSSNLKIALKALVTAIIMQPEFIYRSELGNGEIDQYKRIRLSNIELSQSLSYALDHELDRDFLEAAKNDKLRTKEEVAAIVKKRLDKGLQHNPRIIGFFREYFNYEYANEVFKDPPPGAKHEPKALVEDLEFFISDILEKDKDVLANLLTSNKYFVNYKKSTDKKHRGKNVFVKRTGNNDKGRTYQTAFNLPMDWKWTEKQPITFPENERSGVLTHPAWLAAWSANTENHPVQRGLWVRTHLLGGTVPDVPIGVDAKVPEKENTTFRDRLKLATGSPDCRRCHRKMDELGVVFEQYDHYGRFQRLDAGQPVRVDSIITRTGVPSLDNKKVSGPAEMMQVLASSEYVKQVFVRHVFRYYMGRNETLGDANTLQDAYEAYNKSSGSFKALVVSILSSDSFVYRQIGNQTAQKGDRR